MNMFMLDISPEISPQPAIGMTLSLFDGCSGGKEVKKRMIFQKQFSFYCNFLLNLLMI